MKKHLSYVLLALVALSAACNSASNNSGDNASTSDSTEKTSTNFPFTKEKGRDWEINKDDANTLIALNALKAIENKDYQAISNSTADSVKSDIDGLKFSGTKAQMMQANKDFFATLKNIKIVPHDWVSVINRDKSQEWVSVWYSQYWEDQKGKKDSLNVFNDIRLKNGKIIEWDEFIQHFPKP